MVNNQWSFLKLTVVASTIVTAVTLVEGWWDAGDVPIRSFNIKGKMQGTQVTGLGSLRFAASEC